MKYWYLQLSASVYTCVSDLCVHVGQFIHFAMVILHDTSVASCSGVTGRTDLNCVLVSSCAWKFTAGEWRITISQCKNLFHVVLAQ